MADAGSSLQQKRVEKVVRPTVYEVKRRKKSYEHELVSNKVKIGAEIVTEPALNSRIYTL